MNLGFDKSKFNKDKKTVFCTMLMWIMLITCTAGCANNTEYILTTGFKDGEIFRIENLSCYDTEALVYLANMKNEYTSVYGSEIWSVSLNGVSLGENIKDTVFSRLARIKIMTLMAAENGITLDDKEKQKVKDAAAEYFGSLTDSEKEAMGGITEDTVVSLYEDYALADKVYQGLISSVNTEISDDEARTIIVREIVLYFSQTDENGKTTYLSDAGKKEQEAKAAEAHEMLVSGNSFDIVADSYSEADNVNLYYRKGEMDPDLENAAFLLGEGEYSDVVEGEDGYYIIYCVNPNDVTSIDAVKNEIIRERQLDQFNVAYTQFESGLSCYVNEELWDSLDYNLQMVKDTDSENFFDIYQKYFQ